MKIIVLSQMVIEKLYPELSESAVISITSSSGTPAKIEETKNLKEILFLKFDDLSKKTDELEKKYIYFNEELAAQILAFAEKHKDTLVVCQCEAGISRSAGVAAALANIYNASDKFYFTRYVPNSLVYSEILKLHYGLKEQPWGII